MDAIREPAHRANAPHRLGAAQGPGGTRHDARHRLPPVRPLERLAEHPGERPPPGRPAGTRRPPRLLRRPARPLRDSLLHLATHVRDKNWQRRYEGRISAAALDLASLEEDAEVIRTFQPCLIPGLLQIPAYVRALIAAGPLRSRQQIDALVAFRMSRQRILDRDDPPRYVAVTSQAALLNQVGGSAVMRAQLHRLAKAAQQDHVEFHVFPTSASASL